jgi:hypothetical protein
MRNQGFYGAVRDLAGRAAAKVKDRPVRTFEPYRIIVPAALADASVARPAEPKRPLYVVTD